MAKTIIITFDQGDVNFETTGFSGKECLSETEAFKAALGGERTDFQPTPEMHRGAAPKVEKRLEQKR